MSIQLAPALALALLPVCLDPGPREGPGDELRFAPEQGLRLTKTLRRSSEESLDSSVAYFNDEEQDAETDSSSSSEGLIVLTDEYGASEDEIFAAMVKAPILMERPVVMRGARAAIGRPPEDVLALLG